MTCGVIVLGSHAFDLVPCFVYCVSMSSRGGVTLRWVAV